MPREVAPALASERETPFEFTESKAVPPTLAATTAARSTAQAMDVPATVETVPTPPASIAETPSEASFANSVAPRAAQAAAAPDNNVLPVTREIAATPPSPALPPSMNVATSAPHSPADAENVTAQLVSAVSLSATTEGGSTVTPVTPRGVDVASAAEGTVLSQGAEIAVTAPAAASTRATVPAAQQSRPPSTVETAGAPASSPAAAETGGTVSRNVPPREVTTAEAAKRAGASPPRAAETSGSSEPAAARVVETAAAVTVDPPEIAAFQVAPDPSTAVAVPPPAAAIVEDASAATAETQPAVPRPVERPPRADVASLVPPSEPDAQGPGAADETCLVRGNRRSKSRSRTPMRRPTWMNRPVPPESPGNRLTRRPARRRLRDRAVLAR